MEAPQSFEYTVPRHRDPSHVCLCVGVCVCVQVPLGAIRQAAGCQLKAVFALFGKTFDAQGRQMHKEYSH